MINVRDARPTDRDTIVAYNTALALESEGVALDEKALRAGVAALLRDPRKGRYFIAEAIGAGVAGQLLITFEWSDWRNAWIWWIQSVYVAPQFRRQGVYGALHEHVRACADTDGVAGLRLYVERENRQAHATYEALGMQRSAYLLYEEIWAELSTPDKPDPPA